MSLTNDVLSFEQPGPGISYLINFKGKITLNVCHSTRDFYFHLLDYVSCLVIIAVVNYSLSGTVELQWLEHSWLVYHNGFELVLKSLGKIL